MYQQPPSANLLSSHNNDKHDNHLPHNKTAVIPLRIVV
jgi:hypothetical protein